jgi:hypothetical protein
LHARPEDPVVTSELGRFEVLRAARRAGNQALRTARALVSELDLVALDRAVQDIASDIGGPMLRTLNALHLGSAIVLGDTLTVLVA